MIARWIAALFGVLAVAILLGGCVAVPSSDDPASKPTDPGADANVDPDTSSDPDPESLFEAIYVHSDDLEDVSGTVTSEATDGNRTLGERERVQERPYTDARRETLESSYPGQEGVITVSNATTNWWYYPDEEQAEYSEPPGAPFDSDAIRADRADMAADQREQFDLEYAGTEEIADRETHVLNVEGRNESVEGGISVLVGDTEYVYALETVDIDSEDRFSIVEQTVWIDAEYEYPLKEEVTWETEDGDRVTMTERFEEVTFNQGLDDEAFTFEPPDGTDVSELE